MRCVSGLSKSSTRGLGWPDDVILDYTSLSGGGDQW